MKLLAPVVNMIKTLNKINVTWEIHVVCLQGSFSFCVAFVMLGVIFKICVMFSFWNKA